MKRMFFFLCFFLLFSFSLTFGAVSCTDGIDNDKDGDLDSEDAGCLVETDASERDYGYQIAQDSSVDESCMSTLKDAEISCVAEHYSSFSWLIAFSDASAFSSCLDSYSSF